MWHLSPLHTHIMYSRCEGPSQWLLQWNHKPEWTFQALHQRCWQAPWCNPCLPHHCGQLQSWGLPVPLALLCEASLICLIMIIPPDCAHTDNPLDFLPWVRLYMHPPTSNSAILMGDPNPEPNPKTFTAPQSRSPPSVDLLYNDVWKRFTICRSIALEDWQRHCNWAEALQLRLATVSRLFTHLLISAVWLYTHTV